MTLHRADLKTLWLLGRPVAHSLSPLIQNTALAELGEPLVYLAASVEESQLESAVRGLMSLGALGANVTVPHKEAAFRLCDARSPRANAIGACNVLRFVEGQLLGDNTDGVGWKRGLDEMLGGVLPERAIILGAGGAARAVVHTLAEHGVPELTILNRTPERAHQLAEALTTGYGGRVLVDGLEGWDQRLTPGCLVVQTTSAALREGSAVPLPSFWPPGAVLSELIYGRQTPLAAAVSALGGRVQDGLPMLIHQAAESLAIWLQRPLQEIPVDSMLRAARRRLA